MARKKNKQEKEPNHERWLVSYADFITLLFAVFVTLYAMSITDQKKAEEVIASLRESFGYSTTSPADKPHVIESTSMNIIPSMQKTVIAPPKRGRGRVGEKEFKAAKASIEAYLLKAGAKNKVSVSINKRGLVVSLKEAGFFDSGSATIKKSSYPLLNDVLGSINQFSNVVSVEGHTDNVPISSQTFPSNWELSTTRATNVLQYMTKQGKFDPAAISATGYSEYQPVDDNATEEGRQKNRRVDIVLLFDQNQGKEDLREQSMEPIPETLNTAGQP